MYVLFLQILFKLGAFGVVLRKGDVWLGLISVRSIQLLTRLLYQRACKLLLQKW